MTSTGRKHTDVSPVAASESPHSAEIQSTDSTARSISIITPIDASSLLSSNADSNLSLTSEAQRNFPSSPRHIPGLTEQRLRSSSGASTLPSLTGSPSSSTLSSSSTSLLFSSPISILSNNPPFSATSTSLIMSNNVGSNLSSSPSSPSSPSYQRLLSSRSRSRSRDADSLVWSPPTSPVMRRGKKQNNTLKNSKKSTKKTRHFSSEKTDQITLCTTRALNAMKENDSMVYLDGPRIYTCGECRTHLTSNDEIISKSFHGRHGRAYLFDQCVNYTVGTAEDRRLITGLHSVCDIFCKRCKTLIGWTYAKAYEPSQKYKEGKFIIEKINLHMEENSNNYNVNHPAGERQDRWRARAMSWGSEVGSTLTSSHRALNLENPNMVWEYQHENAPSTLNSSKSHLRPGDGDQSGDLDMLSPVPPKL